VAQLLLGFHSAEDLEGAVEEGLAPLGEEAVVGVLER
jgi:hypothetical protein